MPYWNLFFMEKLLFQCPIIIIIIYYYYYYYYYFFFFFFFFFFYVQCLHIFSIYCKFGCFLAYVHIRIYVATIHSSQRFVGFRRLEENS